MGEKKTRFLRHDCSICRFIPVRARASWKDGVPTGEELSPAACRLSVVGAPYVDDDTGQSNTRLKQCPECGTYYLWTFSRASADKNSEAEIVLHRLPRTAGEKQARVILQTLQASRARFLEEAPSHVETLLHADDAGLIRSAALFLSKHQQYGLDIAFALPALVKALARVSGGSDAAYAIRPILRSYVLQGRRKMRVFLKLLRAEALSPDDPKIESVLVSSEAELRSRKRSSRDDRRTLTPLRASHPAIPRGWFLESVSLRSRFGSAGLEEKPTRLPCGVCGGSFTRQVNESIVDSQWCRTETTAEVRCHGCGAYSVFLNPGY